MLYDAGDGNNLLSFSNTSKVTIGKIKKDVPGGHAGQSIAYTGGSGNDRIRFSTDKFTLAGFLGIDAGAGENRVELYGTMKLGKASAFGESLFYEGGSGNDFLELSGSIVSLAGHANVSTYGGDDQFLLSSGSTFIGSSEGGVSFAFDSGLGADAFSLVAYDDPEQPDSRFGKIVATGGLLMHSGFPLFGNADDHDLFSLECLSLFAPSVTFSGSEGNDWFQILAERMRVGALDYQSGGGSDTISMAGQGHLKHVEVNFGSATASSNPGHSQINIQKSSEVPTPLVLGRHTLPGESRADFSVTFHASGENGFSVSFTHVTFNNTLVMDTGAGDNFVRLDDIRTFGGLNPDTGAGADVVEIERYADEFLTGPSKFTKFVEINLGNGDDTIRIGSIMGSPGANSARFLGGLKIIGGDGTDSMNSDLTSANVIIGTPVIEIEEQDA